MSTAHEIEEAIRGLPPTERDKLLQNIPKLFPEFAGDEEWNRIAQDERPRPALSELLNRYETELNGEPGKYPKIAEGDFDTTA
ncbi:MAG: hypothetical protein QOG67_3618 [Verrucomicrobiota bacterium]|jgi:hypothetical protein